MPSLDFVKSCIGLYNNLYQADNFIISFPIYSKLLDNQRGEDYIETMSIYKDLKINATRMELLASDSRHYIEELPRDSKDLFYKYIRNIYGLSDSHELRAFKFYMFRADYGIHQSPRYYFDFDDIPRGFKGQLKATNLTIARFDKTFFKNRVLDDLKGHYLKQNVDFRNISVHTARYSEICTSTQFISYIKRVENRVALYSPVSANYKITNYEDPSDEFIYERGYSDESTINYDIYYVTLTPFSGLGGCCLAQCFGITE